MKKIVIYPMEETNPVQFAAEYWIDDECISTVTTDNVEELCDEVTEMVSQAF